MAKLDHKKVQLEQKQVEQVAELAPAKIDAETGGVIENPIENLPEGMDAVSFPGEQLQSANDEIKSEIERNDYSQSLAEKEISDLIDAVIDSPSLEAAQQEVPVEAYQAETDNLSVAELTPSYIADFKEAWENAGAEVGRGPLVGSSGPIVELALPKLADVIEKLIHRMQLEGNSVAANDLHLILICLGDLHSKLSQLHPDSADLIKDMLMTYTIL